MEKPILKRKIVYPNVVFLSKTQYGTYARFRASEVHIVYMGSVPQGYSLSSDHHLGILQQVLGVSNAKEHLVRSYTRSFNGFAAKLTEKEAAKLKRMKGVVSVFPSKTLHVQTTRSWDFLGFPDTSDKSANAGSDTIIGVLDTGIWPESESFSDDGFGPIPKKWKGVCQRGQNFTCNNKVIGAKSYAKEANEGTAMDDIGHGTHTASTAAGRKVDHTSFYGLAKGSARGAVPSARIAAYKVCKFKQCMESNILAAFDDAISDGVDLITISIGAPAASPFDEDVIAVGAFHAMKKGILTLQSAGNEGNGSASIGSVAPWLFSIAASSTDRRIVTKVILGDGKTLIGNSVNSFILKGDKFPLVYGKVGSSRCGEESAKNCECLDKNVAKGKIVVCGQMSGVDTAAEVGALGAIALTTIEDASLILPLPAVGLKAPEFDALLSYLNSTKTPMADILKSKVINDTAAPVVVSFSSRGPNLIASDILKPDITAPGVEILAAFPPTCSVSDEPSDKRSVKYNILSGTSMSCPHAAGAAAYVKLLHPEWSPAAIKSALMTTARPMSPSKNPDAEFAYGSGNLNPVGAANPGLVFDADEYDYLRLLCNLGYEDNQISHISGDDKFHCPGKSGNYSSPKDVNYPSISTKVDKDKPFNIKFQRTVTNVGVANSTYVAKVESGSKIQVTVEPKSLSFKSLNEKNSFNVTVVGKGLSENSFVSASLVWSDGTHIVRSPIVVYSFTKPFSKQI